MASPTPKPTKLKVLTGNPGKRKINDQEPEPTAGVPDCPSNLSHEAAKAWKRLAPMIHDMGVLTVVDGSALERMCETYAEIIQYQKDIDEGGATYRSTTDSGASIIKSNPAVSMLANADRRFKAYLVEFGLTPASRSKLKTDKPKAKDTDKGDMGDYFS